MSDLPAPRFPRVLVTGAAGFVGHHLVRELEAAGHAVATTDAVPADAPAAAGLPDNRDHALAQKYMPNGTCGVIAFAVKGTREDAGRFIDRLKFVSIETHVADSRTCVLHPASHTHRQLSSQQLKEAGVPEGLIRLSCGIEAAEDIIADLEQAFGK